MGEEYARDLLRVAVGQICQNIGYNTIYTSSLELLQDILSRFVVTFGKNLRRHTEHDNRTTASLDDVALTFSSLNLSLHELMDYISNVEPVPFVFDVPKFPVKKPSNMNFLKPGSKEVLSRPVHIFEHLPPMLPSEVQQQYTEGKHCSFQNKSLVSFGAGEENGPFFVSPEESKKACTGPFFKIKNESDNDKKKVDIGLPTRTTTASPALPGNILHVMDENGRSAREMVSVVMTSGGFISPAIEGKLPEIGIPSLVEKYFGLDAPPPPTPPPPPETFHASDVSTKSEKNVGESPKKNNALKDISISMTKKTTFSNDSKEKNKFDESDKNVVTNMSSKKNSSKAAAKKGSFVSTHQGNQPIAALKLLKKAKKKNSIANVSLTETLSGNLEDTFDQSNEKLTEKARRKRMKMLQKMMKNSQKMQKGIDSKKELKPLVNMGFPEIPEFSGLERERFEKMLKKQAKLKQKQLKKQLSLNSQKNIFLSPASTEREASVQPLNNVIQKSEQKHEDKQTILGIFSEPVQSCYEKTTILADKDQAQIECVSITKNLGAEEANIFTSPEKQSGLKIKLSNEPDRNKLNIFKKISKTQKGVQLTPPQKQTLLSNTFTATEGQIINLPSGTTITPAPIGFSPSALPSQQSAQESAAETPTLDLSTETASVVNKPKKRGRKPGSKNQPKILPSNQEGTPNLILTKKQKKTNLSNVAKLGHMADTVTHKSNDLGENIPIIGHASLLDQAPYPNPAPQLFLPTSLSPVKLQRKERKEKEKPKNSDIFPITSGNVISNDFKPECSSTMNLSGIHLNPLNMPIKRDEEQNKSLPQKPRKRPYNQAKYSNTSAKGLPAFLSGTPSAPGFPQLSANMLSMLPFAFPPRPGLIPAPGLFATAAGLPTFPNQLSNSMSPATGNSGALLGMGPPFFPFPNLKSPTVSAMDQTKLGCPKERLKDLHSPAPTSFPIDRSYCNVAPLVPPESIRQVGDSSSAISSSNFLPNTTKYPTKNIANPGKGLLLETLKSANPDSSKELLLLHEHVPNITMRKASKGTDQLLSNKEQILSELKPKVKRTPTGGADDPIEVSDDSDELPMPPDGFIRNPFNTAPQTKSQHLPAISLTMPSVLSNVTLPADQLGSLDQTLGSEVKLSKESKKNKKIQKHSKKNTKPSEVHGNSLDDYTSNCSILSGPANDGFSKLAGGADLIPLAGTGSAYSAKSIPSTSLTASRPFNLITPHDDSKDITGVPELKFSDVTIIPNIQKKKSKEHKKVRKLKSGDIAKVKKKKEKKDKSKEKDHFDMSLSQEADFDNRSDKEALKRLKKERKKQKQRSLTNENEALSKQFTCISPNGQPINKLGDSTELSSLSLTMETAQTIPPSKSSVATHVPKITLKIGSSQSPTPSAPKIDEQFLQILQQKREPSPELARFSPLVTRPPKQKIQNDNPTASTSLSSSDSNLHTKGLESMAVNTQQAVVPPPSPWLPGSTLTASSVLLPQQLITNSVVKTTELNLHQHPSSKIENISSATSCQARNLNAASNNSAPMIAETSRPSSYVDAEGNTVWICPACGKVDDGSPMIGCDGCDAWYHWECVGIAVAPNDNEDWFCRVCITRKMGFHSGSEGAEKKKKRNKKK